ncbi:chloride channel protein [Trichocoleus sp. FACHB-591]|uniref:chloride channel protein n=1 Tax=Trichocoleus sp. FACHB-591 TaxID=2692872 RepID=UPI001685AFA1|nr:chloride channel protein [Trichocoleus sp. FACHB-591]MBD2097128.1 chloride channel protein [Trichocoleus sp. FACHB-591]
MSLIPAPDGLAEQPTPAPSTSHFAHILNRLQPTPETVVLILAILIGGGTGMGVVTFHYLIELIHSLMLEDLMGAIAPWGAWTLACVPMLGGVIVGFMRWRWQDFGPGISSLIAATQGKREISPIRPVTKMVAASVSLGTGASLGPEGPSVEIGANFGLLLGQILQVSQERQRLLLGAGAAAGLAAGFNAPIAGVFFALEVVLGTTFATSAVSVVLLAAVVAALIAQIGLGAQPAFALPAYEVRSPLELPLYIGLGLCASLVSVAYTQTIKLAQTFFRGEISGFSWVSRIPRPVHPVIGGACVGLIALALPQTLGIGYETIEALLRDVEFSLPLLLLLLVFKLALTALSLGSGLVGGIFAPAMFLGAVLGASYGKILAAILPAGAIAIAAPPAYAMVGMAAVLAGSVRAPLTAILLLFELTRDYRIVLPLMAAVGLSVWVIESLKPISKPGLNLKQMGVNVEPDQGQEALKHLTVEEAMQPSPLILPYALPVLEASEILLRGHLHSALLVDETGQLRGIVTLQDINRVLAAPERTANSVAEALSPQPSATLASQPVGEICTSELLYAYKDELVTEAIDRMGARGLRQLPVVDREPPHLVVGLLEQERIPLACNLAATRKALQRHLTAPLNSEEISLPTLKQPA